MTVAVNVYEAGELHGTSDALMEGFVKRFTKKRSRRRHAHVITITVSDCPFPSHTRVRVNGRLSPESLTVTPTKPNYSALPRVPSQPSRDQPLARKLLTVTPSVGPTKMSRSTVIPILHTLSHHDKEQPCHNDAS